jgi:hypothetical protein
MAGLPSDMLQLGIDQAVIAVDGLIGYSWICTSGGA